MNAPSLTEPSLSSPMPPPLLRHHFCRTSALSFELPPSWRLEQESEGASTYLETVEEAGSSDREHQPARLVIQSFIVAPGLNDAPQALIQRVMADSSNAAASAVVRTLTVDQQPARLLVQHRQDSSGRWMLHFQVFVQLDQVVCSITGKGAVAREAELLPLFEAATHSIRFIPVSRGT